MYSRKTHGHTPVPNKIERAVETNNFIKKQRSESHNRERMERILEILGADRWSKGQDILKYHRSQCNYMNQSWTQWQGSTENQDPSSVYMLNVFIRPIKPTFPQKNLFQYMSRIYRCCKLGFSCRRIKGLQGILDEGIKEAAFNIDSDIFSLSIQRAELHLEVSADEQLTVIPVLNINGLRRSSFRQMRSGHIIDLALDVMFILQALKETDMAYTVNGVVTELSLSLHCIQNDLHVPCNLHRVSLLQPPFITLQYK
ncbi:uncharacterized protein LOC142743224 [Rhinoderma darwinii]|uniref:uncharacterized protein LOC142743224 n=1 Tax=Rhinoderma darwinii TaxID=43563 RepID=UPI003F66BC81